MREQQLVGVGAVGGLGRLAPAHVDTRRIARRWSPNVDSHRKRSVSRASFSTSSQLPVSPL